MIKVQTLKGFRDFLPETARKRQYVINSLLKVFTKYGFEPLETPTLEYEEVLTGKYGDEGDKLLYRFEDNGRRRVALRYDQTVPLARVIAQYKNELTMPFKRYQISNVWRAENTQKGRFREFTQCDIDTVGTNSVLSDAEIIMIVFEAYKTLGFNNFSIRINDRRIFGDLSIKAITILDKLEKIGTDAVSEELVVNGICKNSTDAQKLLQSITQKKPSSYLETIFSLLKDAGIPQERIVFSPALARGMDYYTGLIFEIQSDDYPFGSLCGGGRYDNLIGMFSGVQTPAVGCAFGFDRTMEAMLALDLFPKELSGETKVLVTIFSFALASKSTEIVNKLRENNINAEIYLGEIKEKNPLEKQLKYANAKNIPYVVIIGEEEIKTDTVALKNMQSRKQKTVSVGELINLLTQ